MTASGAASWFGRLLDWQWTRSGRCAAWHGGSTHYLTKADRQIADAHRVVRGWHLWDDNVDGNPDRWDGFGPGLGGQIVGAKRAAEAWIVCPYADMMGYPKLRGALGGAADWDDLIIRLREDHQRFTIEDRDGTVAALLVPLFLGAGGTTSIRWRALSPAGNLIVGVDTWAGVFAQLSSDLARPAAPLLETDRRDGDSA